VDLGGEFAFLRASVRQSIADIRAAVGVERAGDAQLGAVFRLRFNIVVRAVEDLVDAAAEKFDGSSNASEWERRQTLSNIRSAYPLLNALQQMRPWLTLEGPSALLPLGARAYLAVAAQGVLRRPADVLAVPTDKYTYSAVPQPLLDSMSKAAKFGSKDAAEGSDPAGVPAGPLPLLINVPLQEGPRLLLHVLTVHELAHGAEGDRSLRKAVEVDAPETSEEAKERGDAVTSLRPANEAERAQLEQRAAAIRECWIMEALCDAIAFAWAGPAYLLAFCAFLLRWEEFAPTRKHPSTALRVKLLLAHARELGWSSFLACELAPLTEWLEDVARREVSDDSPEAPLFVAAARYLQRRQGALVVVVRAHLGDDVLDPTVHAAELKRVMELLQRRILPVYTEMSFDPRAITTAGWCHRLDIASAGDSVAPADFPLERLVDVITDHQLQAFLAKAIELNRLVEGWQEIADAADGPS
jgi:hypothetical protein